MRRAIAASLESGAGSLGGDPAPAVPASARPAADDSAAGVGAADGGSSGALASTGKRICEG